ncbi:Acetylornithine deacetylase [Fructilactobacillus florum 8D]|uniref:Acetylornithine deacetylase n=2 Tax=Fructilactobacillus florum TaxID=640331 RepID=W9EFV2_9LACO|nr:ArgE/DapE family deacylase [Fructilactobacillus florum]ETO41013.1 Acetylornithine deacetylase [Fructilactobacillus florum 8D]KRM92285.1 hypothetical protein FC87_GL000415 [Fructilactobacillus florum DSM 22689 = JCM 16035]
MITNQRACQILADLVQIPSVNNEEKRVAEVLANLFQEYDIPAKVISHDEKRANLVAEVGSGQPVLVVTGHLDVVDPGDRTKWKTNPFQLTEKNQILYGRGVSDMKSGLAALAIALINFHEKFPTNHGTVRFLATYGEEIGENGSHDFYHDGYMQDATALLVAEPSAGYISNAEKGSLDLKLTSRGKAAHSSFPDLGFNAIDPLLDILVAANQQLRSPELPQNDTLGSVTINNNLIKGGVQINSLPDEATAGINIRTIPEFTGADAIKKIQAIIAHRSVVKNNNTDIMLSQLVPKNPNKPLIDLEVLMDEPAVIAPADSSLIKLAQTIGERISGKTIPIKPCPGITDASNLMRHKPADFPFLIFGPGNGSSHMPNEQIPKRVYLNFIKIYTELFNQYFS